MKKIITILFSICLTWGFRIGQNKKSIEEIKSEMEKQYIPFSSQINKQLPIRVDDVTILTSVVFSNWVMTNYYSVEIDTDGLTENELKTFLDITRNEHKNQIPRMISNGDYNFTKNELIEYLKHTGLKFRFVYKDINNKFIGANSFDYSDFE